MLHYILTLLFFDPVSSQSNLFLVSYLAEDSPAKPLVNRFPDLIIRCYLGGVGPSLILCCMCITLFILHNSPNCSSALPKPCSVVTEDGPDADSYTFEEL